MKTSASESSITASARLPRRQPGFTFIEIAVVLTVIGLLLGGILKGRELIDNARVRALENDIEGFRVSWLSFYERYRAYPGDFSRASAIIAPDTVDGDGDGRVEDSGDSSEVAAVWQHLAGSGFLQGPFDGADTRSSNLACANGEETCPTNPYGGYYKIAFGNRSDDEDAPNRHELITGGLIPARILALLDLRLDDGDPEKGDLRAHSASSSVCVADGKWNLIDEVGDCAAVLRNF